MAPTKFAFNLTILCHLLFYAIFYISFVSVATQSVDSNSTHTDPGPRLLCVNQTLEGPPSLYDCFHPPDTNGSSPVDGSDDQATARFGRTFPFSLSSIGGLLGGLFSFSLVGTVVYNAGLWMLYGLLHTFFPGGSMITDAMRFVFVGAIPFFQNIGLAPSFIYLP